MIAEARLGVDRDATVFHNDTDFEAIYLTRKKPSCVLLDEAQFLSESQVVSLHRLAHIQGVPVICYGLRSDFQGQPFPNRHIR